MTEVTELSRQTDYLSRATQHCLAIESLITGIELETVNMAKIDFYVQKLITVMHSIDSLHVFLEKSTQTKSIAYPLYLKELNTVVDRYKSLVQKLSSIQKDMANKLHWQRQFISDIFKENKERVRELRSR